MQPIRLYVNIDHVATLRQARRTDEPDPVRAATLCERGGADGITAHLREDRRHIQDADVPALRAAVRTVLNLELATAPDVLDAVVAIRPFQATLVPERREEVTTEGGLDLSTNRPALRNAIARLMDAGTRVSLFLDPDHGVLDQAAALGVPAVELHTGRYAHHWAHDPAPLDQLRAAARHARALGLAVHAGHGLTYRNVSAVAAIPEIEELNIGHSIVSRAVFTGIHDAVSTMRHLVDAARTAD